MLPTLSLLAAALMISAAAAAGSAQQVSLSVTPDSPVVLAGERQTAVIKVALTGFALEDRSDRPPVNVALVLDKSGSMRGDKITRAREAAALALQRLGADDVAAVVAYHDTVRVVVPATRVTDRGLFAAALDRIVAGGRTALFAGVSKGAHEVNKFRDGERFNRVILLSDGLANVGPNSPMDLGRLGASLAKDGISVTTIGLGLGYNEDLMAQLAGMSDGNHAFAETGDDLARLFDAEFGDVLSVVAQQVNIEIQCRPGVRPLRVIGRKASIDDGRVSLGLNQLYSEQEKYILIEVEVPTGTAGDEIELAEIDVAYRNAVSRRTDRLTAVAKVAYSGSDNEVAAAADTGVLADVVEQVANKMSKEAVRLRDLGRLNEAREQLEESAAYLERNAERYNVQALRNRSEEAKREAQQLGDDSSWQRLRKQLKQKQHSVETQQSYR